MQVNDNDRRFLICLRAGAQVSDTRRVLHRAINLRALIKWQRDYIRNYINVTFEESLREDRLFYSPLCRQRVRQIKKEGRTIRIHST